MIVAPQAGGSLDGSRLLSPFSGDWPSVARFTLADRPPVAS